MRTPRLGWGCHHGLLGRGRTCATMMLGTGGASGMLSSAISAATLSASAASMDAICAWLGLGLGLGLGLALGLGWG